MGYRFWKVETMFIMVNYCKMCFLFFGKKKRFFDLKQSVDHPLTSGYNVDGSKIYKIPVAMLTNLSDVESKFEFDISYHLSSVSCCESESQLKCNLSLLSKIFLFFYMNQEKNKNMEDALLGNFNKWIVKNEDGSVCETTTDSKKNCTKISFW